MKNVPPSETSPVLLYDGLCGFCDMSVRTVLRHDRRGTMRFAALQSDYGKALVERHPELKDVDSVILLETSPDTGEERVHVRSDAALGVAAYLGGAWNLFRAARLVPRRARDILYDLFARNRYRLFGKHDSCQLPPPEARARFIDV